MRFVRFQRPVFRPFSSDAPAWPKSILSGHAGFIILRGCRCGEPRQRLAVVPGHPVRRLLFQFLGMPLQLSQIIERIDTVQLACVYQTHEQIADSGAVQCFIEEYIPAVQNRFSQGAFQMLLSIGAPG